MTAMDKSVGHILWIVYNLIPGIFSLAASFYGESYIWLPREDASSITELQLEFRTGRPDALLFLAGGSPDYLLIKLEEGAIRVVMDLGSGEAVLGSHPELVFNDLHWHYIHLYRTDRSIQLNINNMSTITTNSPGQFTELNINRGLFLGSVAASKDLFYGILREYRGCLKNVFFNGLDVLHAAHLELDPLHVYEVNWECSSEFGASSQQPLSFLQNTSFIAFKQSDSYKQGRFTFDVKTRSETALLIYSSGRFTNPDFIALELVGGIVYLTVNKGSGAQKFSSGPRIDDATWHQVEVVINPDHLALSVDGQRTQRQTNFGDSRYLDLYGYLYLGGLGIIARSTAKQLHLQSLSGQHGAAGSLVGCIQNFKMNGELFGFREAEVTKQLLPECIWKFPCTSEPCIEGAQCTEDSYYYSCVCEQTNCYKQRPTIQGPTQPHQSVVHVQSLVTQEGGTSLILSTNLDLVADYTQYGIRDTSVVFRVTSRPEHGSIQVELSQRESDATVFTMDDILQNRVSFVHDGSESEEDSIGLELDFLIPEDIQDADVPEILKQVYGLTLMIDILAWNDKPDVRLPKDGTLILVSNTQVTISPKIIRAMDRDDPPSHLEYTVHYQHGYDIGYFERNDGIRVRARITSFTQEDINEGRIIFIHRGAPSQHIRIQVSDRKDVSEPKTLHISAVPLEISLQSNTGLYVPKGSTNLILKQNLSFTTNTPNQFFPIRYSISVPPFDGELQRQQPADNQWVVTSSFTQQDIDDSRVRYFHFDKPNADDFFKFMVYVMTQNDNPIAYDFNILIVQSGVNLTTNRGLKMLGVRDGYIFREDLHAVSTIPYHSPEDVVFSILTVPVYGQLLRIHQRSEDRTRTRKVSTNFTQADVNAGNILFRLNRALLEPIDDSFEFRVEVPGAETAIMTFGIRYDPVDSGFINNGLMNVREGGQKMITQEDLYMQSEEVYDFTYTVIDAPEYGVIQLVNPNTGTVTNRNATSFTNRAIRDEKVYYKHDDSETVDDYFSFMITPNIHHTQSSHSTVQEIDSTTGNFEIKISLRNDNIPQRVVNKPFMVVSNRGRTLTLDDIKFEDPDVDFDDGDLLYSFRHVTNGEFVHNNNRSVPLASFTQRDIANGKVYFHHFGANYNKGAVSVSDGELEKIEEFEVQVSSPYITIVNNTGLAVKKGESIKITTMNISIDSNLDGLDREFKFMITDPPQHGLIKKNTNDRNRFNLADLKKGQVFYEHDNTEYLEDQFTFSVKFDSTQVEGRVQVKILLSDHQQPLSLIHNRVTPVEELQTVTITKQELLIGHPDVLPVSIRYTITKNPQFGVLTIRGRREEDGSMQTIRKFTQQDVDDNKLMYTHTAARETTDVFKFDVSNGILTMRQQEFVIEVIPSMIPLKVEGFAIPEGGTKSLSNTNIKIKNRYFQKQELEYSIVDPPKHGRITNVDNREMEVVQFNHNQVQRRKVRYNHDDSDTTSDNITFFVRVPDTKYRSNPQTISIMVIPTNDEPPVLVVNEPLNLWIGSSAAITAQNLKVEDKDTSDNQIMYLIGNPVNGQVTLKDNPTTNVFNFTQEQVNKGIVIFRQRVDDESSFQFRVSDGETYTDFQTFLIQGMELELNQEKLRPLEAYPGILQPITSANLKAVTNDVDGTEYRPIKYILQTKPENGLLVMVMNNGTETEITTFSQDDIDNKRVFYHHTSGLVGWTQDDFFVFEVSTLYAERLSRQRMPIKISYEYINEFNRDQLIRVVPPSVEEGDRVVLVKDNLDISKLRRRMSSSGVSGPEVSLVITRVPMYGKLKLNETDVMEGDKLSQRDITRQHVSYVHDDSDTLWDTFHFSLDIETPGQAAAQDSDFNTVFNITVIPKNDQPFRLVTNDPKIKVVQGFMANISKVNLNTEDLDTIPAEIYYEVVTSPSHGLLVSTDNLEMPIGDFTQQDINDGKIKYLNDGSRISDAFYFKVTDGKHLPSYKVFGIHVHPLTLSFDVVAGVEIEQGLFSQYLNENIFNVTTNGKINRVMYNVTRPPSYGQLYMHYSPVSHFSHVNVINREITYIQSDGTRSRDSFEFTVYDTLNTIAGKTVEIKVIAAMKKSETPPQVPAGESLTFTLEMLNASHLASITQSDPVYSVTNGPRLGSLSMISRQRLRRMEETDFGVLYRYERSPDDDDPAEYFRFTHKDIQDGIVQYEPESSTITAPETDEFSFILKAHAAQPAHGSFEITVLPSKLIQTTPKPGSGGGATKEPPGGSKTTPKSGASEAKDANSKALDDHLMIVYIVSAVTVAAIVLIITIKCVKHKKKRKKQRLAAMKEDSKTPLSQPVIQPDLTYPKHELQYSGRSHGYDNGPRIPTINITPDSEAGSLGSHGSHESSANARVPPKYPEYGSAPRHPQARPHDRPDITMPRPPTQRSRSPPKTPDPHRQDLSRAVPTCKVTPLADGEEVDDQLDKPEQVVFDWENIDPELLQHCRTTNPVLHDNKYWV